MRHYIIVWICKVKEQGMRIGRWVRRHTLLAAMVLLLIAVISPRDVQGQLPSPCCGNPGGRSGNDQQHVGQRHRRRLASNEHGSVGY